MMSDKNSCGCGCMSNESKKTEVKTPKKKEQ